MSDLTARSPAVASARLSIATMALLTMVTTSMAGKLPPKSFQTDSPQPAPQAAPDQAAQPSGPASPTDQLDLLNGIGKLFGDPSSIFPALPTLKRETIDDLNARAKDATDGLSRLTAPLIARGRMMCPASADGAPDCKVASDKLCQAKGFKEGESLDTDSAQSCSAAALLSGGNREPGNCRTNHYVTRALCQ
jgi:hypothetical protein